MANKPKTQNVTAPEGAMQQPAAPKRVQTRHRKPGRPPAAAGTPITITAAAGYAVTDGNLNGLATQIINSRVLWNKFQGHILANEEVLRLMAFAIFGSPSATDMLKEFGVQASAVTTVIETASRTKGLARAAGA